MTKDCKLIKLKKVYTKDKQNNHNGVVIPILNQHEEGTLPIEQVYLTTCLPEMVKGPHVHSGNKHDRFYCVKGMVVVVCRNEETQRITEFILDSHISNQYLLIPPNNSHALLNLSSTELAVVLSMPNEGYEEDKPYNQTETEYEGYDWEKWNNE